MNNAIDQILLQTGEEYDFASGRSFVLNDREKCFFVIHGTVDIFSVFLENGKTAGIWQHVVSSRSGQLFFGLPSGSDGEGFIASCSSETQLVVLDIKKLRDIQEPGALDQLAKLIDRWIGKVSHSIFSSITPAIHTELTPGTQAIVGENQSAMPTEPIIWLSVEEGRGHITGNDKLPPVTPGMSLTLTQRGWLLAQSQMRLRCFSTREALSNRLLWRALDQSHSFYLFFRQQDRERLLLENRERQQQKQSMEHASVDQAFSRLAGLLEKKSNKQTIHQHDALLGAFQLIGEASGIQFQWPGRTRLDSQPDAVTEICEASGVKFRRIALSEGWWNHDAGPILGFLKVDNLPIALIPNAKGNYNRHNVKDGSTQKISRSVSRELFSAAYMFYRPFPTRPLSLWDLATFCRKLLKQDMLKVLVIGFLGALISLVTPIMTGIVYDVIIPGAERFQLLQVTLGLLVATIAVMAFEGSRGLAILHLQGRATLELEAAIWDRLTSLPVSFFGKYSSGDLANRAMGVWEIRRSLNVAMVTIILTAFFSTVNLALMFWYSIELGLLASGLLLLLLLVVVGGFFINLRHANRITTLEGRIQSFMYQLLTGISKIRVAGAENRVFVRWVDLFARKRDLLLRIRLLQNVQEVLFAGFPLICTTCIFLLTLYLETDASRPLTTGEFLAYFTAFTTLLTAMVAMGRVLSNLVMTIPQLKRTKPILEAVPETQSTTEDIGQLMGRIEVNHVSFSYSNDNRLVLDDVSLELNPGEFVAVVGASGSGKSTLLRLLLGFEEPKSGGIYLDNQDLATYNLRSIRRQIGVVLQDSKLVPGDIRTNILGASDLTLEDAWEAARLAGLDDDIRKMPSGMFTLLLEGASTLSGGQRQRLLIARALVRRPRIIFFDEATSALDNKTQEVVKQSLSNLHATRLVIAHRLSTIVGVDRIYVLDSGKIVQQGTYEELMSVEGTFQSLVRHQLI